MSDSTGAGVGTAAVVTAVAARRGARRQYRHRAAQCSRLLFVGYLPPGTYIEIRCPACDRIHIIRVPPEEGDMVIDSEQEFG